MEDKKNPQGILVSLYWDFLRNFYAPFGLQIEKRATVKHKVTNSHNGGLNFLSNAPIPTNVHKHELNISISLYILFLL